MIPQPIEPCLTNQTNILLVDESRSFNNESTQQPSTQIISHMPPSTYTTLPCALQSRPINLKTHDPTLLQTGNELGYPITTYGVPFEYYQQNPPPRVGYYEGLYQPISPDQNAKQLCLIEENQMISLCGMAFCCPCATCYVCCCVGGRHSHSASFCQCCNELGSCSSNAKCGGCDCSGPCGYVFGIVFLIVLAIIAIIILTAIVSIPIILISLPFYGMYKVYNLRVTRIVLNDENREIRITTRRRYFKKDEILSESVFSYDSIQEIKVKELDDKKKYIIAKLKEDKSINFSQFMTNMSEKELDKGAQFLRSYFALRGTPSLQLIEQP